MTADPRHAPGIGRRLVAGLLIAAAMLLALEGLLRLAWKIAGGDEPSKVVLANPHDPEATKIALPAEVGGALAGSIRYNIASNVLTAPDPHLIFHVRPNPGGQPVYCYEGIDGDGLRTRDAASIDPLDRTTLRVLLAGDSCAFSWGLCRFESTIAGQLERGLAERSIRARVLNLAQPGYSTAQGRVLLHDWLPRVQPTFVVLYFGWNDGWPTPGIGDAELLLLLPLFDSPWMQSLTRTAIYRTLAWAAAPLLSKRAASLTPGSSAHGLRVPLASSVANYRAMIDESRSLGAKVVVIAPPHRPGSVGLGDEIESFNRAIAEAFAGEVVLLPLPEMRPGNPESRDYFQNDGYHPNERGARTIAEAIAEAVALPMAGAGTA